MMKLSTSNIIKTIALCLLLQSNGMPGKDTSSDTSSSEELADEFYVFNVGQGNCNLFIPKDLNSGIILYDAGSSAGPFNKKMERTAVDTDFIIKTISKGFKNRDSKHLEVVVSHADKDHLNFIREII